MVATSLFAPLAGQTVDSGCRGVIEDLEARDKRLTRDYESALLMCKQGHMRESKALIEGLISDPAIAAATPATVQDGGAASITAPIRKLRFLALKFLAELSEDGDDPAEALRLYCLALQMEDDRALLWQQMGTLAAELGCYGIARCAFHSGLQRNPRHAPLLDRVADLTLWLGDLPAAAAYIQALQQISPVHPATVHKTRFLAQHTSADDQAGPWTAEQSAYSWAREAGAQMGDAAQSWVLQMPELSWAALLRSTAAALHSMQHSSVDGTAHPSLWAPVSLSQSEAAAQAHGVQLLPLDRPHADASMRRSVSSSLSHSQPAAPGNAGLASGLSRRSSVDSAEDSGQAGEPSVASARPPLQSEGTLARAAAGLGADSARAGSAAADVEASVAEDGGQSGEEQHRERKQLQRTSRRVTSSRSNEDRAGDEPVKGKRDVMQALSFFLAPHADAASGAEPADDLEDAAVPSQPFSQDTTTVEAAGSQEIAVQSFIAGLPASCSIVQLSVALVERLALDEQHALGRAIPQSLLELADHLDDLWRPEACYSMALAEHHLRAAMLQHTAHDQSPPSAAAVEQHLQRCDHFLAAVHVYLFHAEHASSAAAAELHSEEDAEATASSSLMHVDGGAAAALQQADGSMPLNLTGDSSCMSADRAKLLVRLHWVRGLMSQLQGQEHAALQHFGACETVLHGMDMSGEHGELRLLGSTQNITAEAAARRAKIITVEAWVRQLSMQQATGQQSIHQLADAVFGTSEASEALRAHEATYLTALTMLQELAAAAADNSTELMGLELQALLTLAAHLLPARQLASLDANSSSKLATPQLQRALQCLAELLKILGQHNAYSAAEGMPQLVSKVQLRLSLFIRACYSTLNNSQLQPAQADKHRMALAVSMLALCSIFAGQHPPARAEAEALGACADLLVDCSALHLLDNAFLRHCLGRMLLCPFRLFEPAENQPSGQEQASEGSAPELQGVEDMLAPCIYLLYGIKLRDWDCVWLDDDLDGPVADEAFGTMQQCMEAWRALRPIMLSTADSEKGIERFKELLTRLGAYFPSPPATVLDTCLPHLRAILDSTAFDTYGSHATSPAPEQHAVTDPIMQEQAESSAQQQLDLRAVLQPPEAAAQAVQQDPDREIHTHLYSLLRHFQTGIDEELDKQAEKSMLLADSHEAVEQAARLAMWDLCYNPERATSWGHLPSIYLHAVERLTDDAAMGLSSQAWSSNAALQMRLASYRRQWANAGVVAIHLLPPQDQGKAVILDELALCLLQQVQHTPPQFDHLDSSPVQDEAYIATCQAADHYYKQAARYLPDEWQFSFFRGKLAAKMGTAALHVLHLMAQACHMANKYKAGQTEPLYRLHASRLKLLSSGSTPAHVIAAHPFLPETPALLEGSPAAEHADILRKDCHEAMLFCLDGPRSFFKPRYHLAKLHEANRQPHEALAQLQPLFSTGRGFKLKVPQIEETSDAKAASAATDQAGTAVPESQWGMRPARTAGNGLHQETPKYVYWVCKALRLYLHLLACTGDLDMLQKAVPVLQQGPGWVKEGQDVLADLARLAQRLFHTELVAQLHAGLKSMPEGLAHLLADSTPEDAPPALQHWCSRLQAVQAQQCEAAGSNPAGSPDGVFAADLPPLLANPGDSRAPDLACRLYIDQALDAEGRQWDHVLSAQAAEGRSFHAAWTGQAAFRCYALLCIAALGCAGMLTEVQGLQALLRRRTKNVQGSGQREEGERLHAAVAWALLTAVHVQTSKLHAWIVSSPLPASPSAPSGPQRGAAAGPEAREGSPNVSSGLSNSPSPSAPYARPAPSADATSLHTKRKRSPEDADTEADDAGTLGLTPSKRAMRARKPHAPAARPQAVEGSRQLAPLARQMSQHVDGVRAEDGVWTGRQRSSMAVLRQAHELYKARKGSPGALLKPQTEAALHRGFSVYMLLAHRMKPPLPAWPTKTVLVSCDALIKAAKGGNQTPSIPLPAQPDTTAPALGPQPAARQPSDATVPMEPAGQLAVASAQAPGSLEALHQHAHANASSAVSVPIAAAPGLPTMTAAMPGSRQHSPQQTAAALPHSGQAHALHSPTHESLTSAQHSQPAHPARQAPRLFAVLPGLTHTVQPMAASSAGHAGHPVSLSHAAYLQRPTSDARPLFTHALQIGQQHVAHSQPVPACSQITAQIASNFAPNPDQPVSMPAASMSRPAIR